MSCQYKLFSRISALSEKSFCLTGNPIKTLLAILFLIVGEGDGCWGGGGGGAGRGQIADFRKITSGLFNYYKRMLKI